MNSKVFSVATNQDGIEFLCEYGEPVFNLSNGSILLNEHLSSDTITRPATMGEINAWRRVKTPHSFTDIGRPAISSVKQEVQMTKV